ncbi:MAG: metallophosphoesterase [Armatimonadota bacterium]
MNWKPRLVVVGLTALVVAASFALIPRQGQGGGGQRKGQGQGQGGRKKGSGGDKQGQGRLYPPAKSAWSVASIILGNGEDKQISMAIHPGVDFDGYIEYGPEGKSPSGKTPTQSFKKGVPTQLTLTGLKPNTAYSYSLNYTETGESKTGPKYRFQTARPAGSTYTMFVQGDSHPERIGKMNDPELYEKTYQTAASYNPDFFIMLGDDFSVDTLQNRTLQAVEYCYTKQVPYMGLIGKQAPIYLVNGNHEQAAKANLDGTPNSLGVLAQNARNRNFVNPAPDSFFTGNPEPVEHIGLLRNYFAWTWGDALYVTIDPYWHSDEAVDNRADGGSKRKDLWGITLGDTQYKWLKKTLETSKAKYKFVFAHHVMGTGRGAVERATSFEWGDAKSLSTKRPGWELPIHQLFVKTGVSIFFQGHDHIFCKQELDGVVYQSCPCPSDTTEKLINGDAYTVGDKIVGSGLVKVTVGPDKAHIEFLRSWLPAAETDGKKHGEVAYSYDVKPKVNK